jgi:hypothetical protein
MDGFGLNSRFVGVLVVLAGWSVALRAVLLCGLSKIVMEFATLAGAAG